MIELVYDGEVADFVSRHLQNLYLGPCSSIGIKKNGKLVAGVVYNNYRTTPDNQPISIEANIVILDKISINKYSLTALFNYPFVHLAVKRLQMTCARTNTATRNLIERLGFRFEGIVREGWHFGGDAAAYSMLKHECRWISYEPRRSQSPRSNRDSSRANPG